jgi:hypothetical protein
MSDVLKKKSSFKYIVFKKKLPKKTAYLSYQIGHFGNFIFVITKSCYAGEEFIRINLSGMITRD